MGSGCQSGLDCEMFLRAANHNAKCPPAEWPKAVMLSSCRFKRSALSTQRIRSKSDIHKRSRIPTAFFINAAIFNIPDGKPFQAKSFRGVIHQCAISDFLLPATAMNHQNNRMWAVVFWLPIVDNIGGLWSGINCSSRRRAGARLQFRAALSASSSPARSAAAFGHCAALVRRLFFRSNLLILQDILVFQIDLLYFDFCQRF